MALIVLSLFVFGIFGVVGVGVSTVAAASVASNFCRLKQILLTEPTCVPHPTLANAKADSLLIA